MLTQDEAKKLAGVGVIDAFVRNGMKLGLGSGTTSHFFVRELSKHIKNGLQVQCTTTSKSTIAVAHEVGIEIMDLNEMGELDLTIDGPDEIDNEFRMIKGGGACLLWEKIVAHASKRMVTICDESKIVPQLGKFPLPVEVIQFGWKQTQRLITRTLAAHGLVDITITQRHRGENVVVTDSGNFILDCHCGQIKTPEQLEIDLNRIPGVVENGLFTREACAMVIGNFDGTVSIRHRDGKA